MPGYIQRWCNTNYYNLHKTVIETVTYNTLLNYFLGQNFPTMYTYTEFVLALPWELSSVLQLTLS